MESIRNTEIAALEHVGESIEFCRKYGILPGDIAKLYAGYEKRNMLLKTYTSEELQDCKD